MTPLHCIRLLVLSSGALFVKRVQASTLNNTAACLLAIYLSTHTHTRCQRCQGLVGCVQFCQNSFATRRHVVVCMLPQLSMWRVLWKLISSFSPDSSAHLDRSDCVTKPQFELRRLEALLDRCFPKEHSHVLCLYYNGAWTTLQASHSGTRHPNSATIGYATEGALNIYHRSSVRRRCQCPSERFGYYYTGLGFKGCTHLLSLWFGLQGYTRLLSLPGYSTRLLSPSRGLKGHTRLLSTWLGLKMQRM